MTCGRETVMISEPEHPKARHEQSGLFSITVIKVDRVSWAGSRKPTKSGRSQTIQGKHKTRTRYTAKHEAANL